MKLSALLIFVFFGFLFDIDNCDCDEYPVLYQHDSFDGRCLRLPVSNGGFKNYDFNDMASSVCVPDGWQVILYEHANYEGKSLTITGPYKNSDLKRNKPDGMNWGG